MEIQMHSIEIDGQTYWYGATEDGEPISQGYQSRADAERIARRCVEEAEYDDIADHDVYQPPAGGVYVEKYLGLE